ncbi:MAG: hypothetical protein R8M45_01035, partial [Ghiorsea sp.]
EILQDIQAFLTKPIHTLSISKGDYSETVTTTSESLDLKQLVNQHDTWLSHKKPKKRKPTKKKKG